jgi:hypothetical protein
LSPCKLNPVAERVSNGGFFFTISPFVTNSNVKKRVKELKYIHSPGPRPSCLLYGFGWFLLGALDLGSYAKSWIKEPDPENEECVAVPPVRWFACKMQAKLN